MKRRGKILILPGTGQYVEHLRTFVASEPHSARRTNNKAASIKENSTAVRLRMDALYDDMTTMAFVQSVAAPTAETATFINNLNALINETSALYNQRIAAAKAAKKKPEEDILG